MKTERGADMISEVQYFTLCNRKWACQEFHDEEGYTVNLYNDCGDFVEEFHSYEDMRTWIKNLELLSSILTKAEARVLKDMCCLAVYNFSGAKSQAYCPNETEKNAALDFYKKLYYINN